MSNEHNSRFRSSDLSNVKQFGDDLNNLNRGFTGGESSILDLTNELDEYKGRGSSDGVETEVSPDSNHAVKFPLFSNREQVTSHKLSNQFQKICGDRQGTPYTYDRFGQLEWNAGYGKEVIEHYLCNHHFYGERRNFKNCGLTLWIQRAPQVTDCYGATPPLCLYKECHGDENRYIQAGDVRIAFDEKTALGLERDPRINAGYVHLKCLEAHIPYHRQIFATLNFKVEGRGPHKKDPWLRNPTIFTTMSQIIYAEEYIEGCSKGSRDGGRNSHLSLLSAGIEKELRGAHPAVREVERKILEMEGWDDLKALIDLKYAQVCSTALAEKKFQSPHKPRVSSSKSKGANRTNREAYTKKKDHSRREEILAAKEAKKRAGRRSRYESSQTKESKQRSSKHSKRRQRKRDLPPKRVGPEETIEPQPLKKGEGKIKTKMFIKDGEEVWAKYEDPWSPLISDIEEDTEESRDDEDLRDDEDSGDDEASSDDEPRSNKRMRLDEEDDLEGDEPQERDHKRKRAY